MARQIADIQNQIITQVQADPDLSPNLTSTSKRAIWRIWTFVVATAIGFFEQLLDILKASVEATAASAIPNTAAWIQNKVFQFQYDAITPQIVQLVNLVPQYPVIDTTKCIVTRCSVRTDLSKNVLIKVAKGTPPGALASAEISALQSYIDTIGVAGVNYSIISLNPDLLFLSADIYYQGQYAAVIQASVIDAINGFLASLPFDGAMKLSDLENAIRDVAGVTDVVFKHVSVRRATDSFGSGSDIVLSQTTIARLWNTVAGYVVGETTTGQTLTDTLNLIAE